MKLNRTGFEHAKKLIGEGKVVVDERDAWSEHQPSTQQENHFIDAHGFSEYGKWHLGIDERRAENTKARYKFPYGDFKNVHRSALLAVKSRAHQYGYANIESAAVQLLEMIHSEKKQAASAPWLRRRSATAGLKTIGWPPIQHLYLCFIGYLWLKNPSYSETRR